MKVIKLTEAELINIVKNVIAEEDMLRLRKLTLKSKWDFNNKHQGWTIEQVLKFSPKSILWAYLNLQAITFMDDILDELQKKYPALERIEKPGIDKEQYEILQNRKNPWEKFSYQKLLNILTAKKLNNQPIPVALHAEFKKKKDQHIKDAIDARDPFTNVDRKEKMQRKNQGKPLS